MAYQQPQLTRYKTNKKRSDTSTLAILCLCSFVALGAFVGIKMAPDSGFSLSQFFTIAAPSQKNEAVMLGGIELGSSMDSALKTHPGAAKSITSSGAITMAFGDKDTHYIVWYGENKNQTVAYKARQNRTLVGITEDEFVGNLTTKFGPPSLSSCSRRIENGLRDCHFSWWIGNDIRLDLTSRQFTNRAIPKLKITLQTTDTRMALRLQRSAKNKTALKASSVKVF